MPVGVPLTGNPGAVPTFTVTTFAVKKNGAPTISATYNGVTKSVGLMVKRR